MREYFKILRGDAHCQEGLRDKRLAFPFSSRKRAGSNYQRVDFGKLGLEAELS